MSDFVLLYSHCILVRGACRSAICDLQRHDVYLIPDVFADLFLDGRYYNLKESLDQLSQQEHGILEEYTTFLEQKELAFYCEPDELGKFAALPQEWLFPGEISNCILDTDSTYGYFTKEFLMQLGSLHCYFIQFRLYGIIDYNAIRQILELIHPSHLKSVEFIFNIQDWTDFEQRIIGLVENNPKISRMVISGTDESKILKAGTEGMGTILFIKDKISSHQHCGIIDNSFFSVNIPTYTESLIYNTCLNRKVSIDINGNIKNCPSMKESYGNIKETTLIEAIAKPSFKKHWTTSKDQISICKDCEFRHICTDCRAYIEDPEDDYSKPLKCGYDPYTCEWEEWSQNPLKQKIMEYYGMRKIA